MEHGMSDKRSCGDWLVELLTLCDKKKACCSHSKRS